MDWPTDLAEVAFRYNLISPLLDPAVPEVRYTIPRVYRFGQPLLGCSVCAHLC